MMLPSDNGTSDGMATSDGMVLNCMVEILLKELLVIEGKAVEAVVLW